MTATNASAGAGPDEGPGPDDELARREQALTEQVMASF
ncbi:MAG: hypothetical protein JWP17_857, partial [Solirubrobacterales bacterium]|nr:hypothetical protein [Solirubrobacterales bacterium]